VILPFPISAMMGPGKVSKRVAPESHLIADRCGKRGKGGKKAVDRWFCHSLHGADVRRGAGLGKEGSFLFGSITASLA